MGRCSNGSVWTMALAALVGAACSRTHVPRAPAAAVSPSVDDAQRVRAVAEAYAAGFAEAFPDQAEYVGLHVARHDRLPDNSLAALTAFRAREDEWLRSLTNVNLDALWGKPEWALAGYLESALSSSVGMRVCRLELWPAHQFGWQTTLLTILASQPLGSPNARADALARWRGLPRYLDTEVENLREGLRLGYSVPQHNAKLAVVQLDALLASPNASPLGSPLQQDSDDEFRASWQTLLDDAILPAIRRYRDFLRDEYAPRARTSLGLDALPNGAACYRASLVTYTSSNIDPSDLYRRGEALIAEREAKGLELARRLYGPGITDVRAAKAAMDADPRNRFASTNDAVAFIQSAMDRATLAAPRWFERTPRAPLVLAPYDEFQAKTHPGARYEPASADGSRPARFRVDVTNFAALTRADAANTTFHEAIPGHHLQIGLEHELGNLGPRAVSSAVASFIEGWARYAEGLADEMALYGSDLERLGAILHLPTGLLVDPGIHAFGWTRERAITWVKQRQVSFNDEQTAAYVDRIAVWPAQMVSYGVGELDIITLRREAEAALGARFDVRAFHAELLRHGAITLPMARNAVRRWVALRSKP
ncbi:MAG: DUF885 domain-containing protein [Myxococcota bacterium]